jgi:hypothetical protein
MSTLKPKVLSTRTRFFLKQKINQITMPQPNQQTTQQVHPAPLLKRMLQGAGVAFILIATFLATAGEPDPGWPRLWMIKPLIIVPLAGAIGGLFYYYIDHLGYQRGWRKTLAMLLSLAVYVFGLWLGTVLGLNGTMWD